jgi:hypothetical protein
MTTPLLRLREYAWPSLPVWQCLFVIVSLADATRFPTTFGTVRGAGAIEKVREAAGAAL